MKERQGSVWLGRPGVWLHSPFMSTALYPLATFAQIERTPSREDGIPQDLEEDLRAYGCKLVHQAGILLKQYGPRLHFHLSLHL